MSALFTEVKPVSSVEANLKSAFIFADNTACAKNSVLQALLMAVWRRKPKSKVLIHSDQGPQFTSMDWASFLHHHNLEHSMSRRGNCHDNAVAESFFNLLKRERIRRHTYKTREKARRDGFDYIEMFYNPKRLHSHLGYVPPDEYENTYSEAS